VLAHAGLHGQEVHAGQLGRRDEADLAIIDEVLTKIIANS
jgi:hypothetical protein